MLWFTHLAIAFFVLMLIRFNLTIDNIFIAVFLISSLLPDIDSEQSFIGKRTKPFSRIIQWLAKHRGFIHSLNFCLRISLILVFIFPKAVIPFFFGYSLHLFADGFTKAGVRIFYPLKFKLKGFLRVGSFTEKLIFVLFLIIDMIFLLMQI